jgi:acylphosphatase
MIQHVSIKVSGYVQGVFFRYHSKEMAESLGITGWVTNQNDGSVRIEAEGDEAQLNQFISWCRHGPRGAVVDKVETSFSPLLQNYSEFKITYSPDV